jgi:predicted metal-dependent peptidase
MLNREKPSDPTMTHCIMFFIDASGSMNDNQLSKIMSIIHGTLPSEIERAYYSFDTEVYKLSGFHTMMGKKKPRPGEEGYFEPVGGGGTDLDCVITEVENMMRNKRKSVDGIVVFTDGYFQQVTLPHPEKWLFMLTADHSTSAIDASAKKPVKKYAMDENFFSFKGFMIEDASARSDAPPPEKKDMTPRDKLALLKKVLDAFKKFDIGVSDVKIAS